jgi:electron transfer flavoprotein beta subunit
MAWTIVVCVKHTPSSAAAGSGPDVPMSLNPLDEYAVEEALRLKERLPGSKVLALSLGAPASEDSLRTALSLGADSAVLLCDPAFGEGDPFATSYLLSRAVEKLRSQEPVGLVLTGKQTNDGESGQVPALLAAWLRWPSALSVRKIPEASEGSVTVERLMEDGAQTLRLETPAVLSVTKEINEPRLPSLKGKMAARKASIPRWGACDLGAEAENFGENRPTRIRGSRPVPPRPTGEAIEGKSAQEKAAALALKLQEMKLL